MRRYNLSEARDNFTEVLDAATGDDVIIEGRDGNRFQVLSIGRNVSKITAGKSPLGGIKGVNRDIPLGVLLAVIREGRAGGG